MSDIKSLSEQQKLANILAPIVSPESYNFIPGYEDYIRGVFGEKAADNFIRERDYTFFLERQGRFGEYILQQVGCEPPYEVSVPKAYWWLSAERIEELKSSAEPETAT